VNIADLRLEENDLLELLQRDDGSLVVALRDHFLDRLYEVRDAQPSLSEEAGVRAERLAEVLVVAVDVIERVQAGG
jgi:uncharacterized protein (DUF2384 family)